MSTESNPFANQSNARRVTFDDDSLKGGGGTREPLPEGDYFFKVLSHGPKTNHKDMDELKLAEVETDKWIFDNLVYRPKAIWKVAQVLVAAGVVEEVTPGMEIDVPDLTDMTIRARVFIDDKTNPPRNRIGEYLPPIK